MTGPPPGAVQYVDEIYSLTAGMVSYVFVACPTGTLVIGGGMRTQVQYTKTLHTLGAPDPVANAWHIDFDNSDSGTPTMATAYAICMQVAI